MDLPVGFEQKTVIIFNQWDLRNLVKAIWDKEYDVGDAIDYPHNGSYYDYEIVPDGYEGEYLLDQGKFPTYENEEDGYFDLDRVIERLEHPFLRPGVEDVLTALAESEAIPYGDYILHYWW